MSITGWLGAPLQNEHLAANGKLGHRRVLRQAPQLAAADSKGSTRISNAVAAHALVSGLRRASMQQMCAVDQVSADQGAPMSAAAL